MLAQLYIRNVAVIQEASIDLAKGLNVFTGETGAGKSVLIHSINAVLGERTSKDIIRTGEKKALVSALFTGLPPRVLALAEELGFPLEDGELLLSREIGMDGKSSCKIGGRPATAALLRELGGSLINIHGQQDTHQLMAADKHIGFVDGFGLLNGQLREYQGVYRELCQVREELSSSNLDEAEKARRIDLLQYQIGEIEEAGLRLGEEEELDSRKRIIKNAQKISDSLARVYSILTGEDGEGLLELLDQVIGGLGEAGAYLDGFGEFSGRAQEMRYELEEYAASARDALEEMEYNPQELDAIEQRLDTLYRLKKKYGSTVEEILAFQQKASGELEGITLSEERTAQLEAQKQALEAKAKSLADELTKARLKAAGRLCQEVRGELIQLDMPSVTLTFSHREKALGPMGQDDLELLISTNPGEPPKPLAKIASGGEISRVMLAIKNVMASEDEVGTLIFDEVDTGVSGRAAQKIGRKLKQVAEHRQVICVTHLAQVAAYGDHHLLIQKEVRGDRTYTNVLPLTQRQRVEELARIIGGENITEISLQNAREMLTLASGEKRPLDK